MNLQEQTRNVAAQGRYGDSMLMHVNPSEVRGLSQVLPITTNPETGMPEAFRIADLKPLLPILGSVVGAGILGPTLGPVAASSIGSGVAQWAGSGSFEKGLLSALTGAALGSVMKGAAMKGAADAGVESLKAGVAKDVTQQLMQNPDYVTAPVAGAADALNPAGEAARTLLTGQQLTEPALNYAGNQAAMEWAKNNPTPGLGDLREEIFRGGFGEGMGRLASGVMQPSALAGIGAGMGPLAVMDSQERFEEQIAEQEREDEEKRRLNFLMNPEPILYSAQGGRTGFDAGGDTDLGGDDSGSGTGAGTWDEEDWEDSQMKQAPDLQSYLVNPEFLAGFQPETMYFDPFTMNQPVSSFDNPYWEDEDLSPEDRMAIGQTYPGEEYAGSRGGYDTPGFSIAPNQVINPYIPYEGMAPPGLIETPSIPYPDMGGLPVPDPNDPLPNPALIEPPLPGLGIPGLPGDPGMQPPVGAPPAPPAVGEPPPFTLPDDPIDTGIGGGFGIGGPPGAPIGAPPPPPLTGVAPPPPPVISPPVGVAPPAVIPPVALPDDPIDTGIGGGPGIGGPGMPIGAPPVLPPEFISPGQPPVEVPVAPPVQPPTAGGPGMGGPGMGGPGMRPPMPPPPAMPPPMPPMLPPKVAPPIAQPMPPPMPPIMPPAPPAAVPPPPVMGPPPSPPMVPPPPPAMPPMPPPQVAPPVQPPMGFFGDTDTDDSPVAPPMSIEVPPLVEPPPPSVMPSPVMQPPIAPPVQPPIAPPGFGPRPPGFGGRPGFDPSSLFFDPRFLGRRRFDKGGETAEEVDEGKAAGGMTDSNAEGALVQAATDPMQDPLTQEVIMFIAGESDNQQAINDFIEKYGTEAFLQLRDAVLKSIVPGAQTEGLIEGAGQGGMADDIPGMIGDQEQIAVSQDEFIVPADVVSALGDGSSGAGSERLYEMMNRVRQAKTGGVTQPRPIDPNKVMPA